MWVKYEVKRSSVLTNDADYSQHYTELVGQIRGGSWPSTYTSHDLGCEEQVGQSGVDLSWPYAKYKDKIHVAKDEIFVPVA